MLTVIRVIGFILILSWIYVKFIDKDPQYNKWKSLIPIVGLSYAEPKIMVRWVYEPYQLLMIIFVLYIIWNS